MSRRSIALLSLAVLIGGLVLYKHVSGKRVSSRLPAELPVLSAEEEAVFGPMLAALETKDYAKAHGLLHGRFQASWPLADFAKAVGGVREQIGGGWAPRSAQFCGSRGPQGRHYRGSYRLASDFASRLVLSLAAQEEGERWVIVSFGLSCPYDEQQGRSADARQVAADFVDRLREERYDAAIDMLCTKSRGMISPAGLRQVRSALWQRPDRRLVVSEDSCRQLTNGRWLDVIFFCSKEDPVSFFAVMVTDEEGAPKVASFDMKLRVPDR